MLHSCDMSRAIGPVFISEVFIRPRPMTARLALPEHTRREIRTIRDFKVFYSDLQPLVAGYTKLPGVLINAFAAALQTAAENDASIDCDWCVFSSYACELVRGTRKENSYFGSLMAHIKAIVRILPGNSL